MKKSPALKKTPVYDRETEDTIRRRSRAASHRYRPHWPIPLYTARPASPSVASPLTPKPIPLPSSCSSWPPSATSSAPRLTALVGSTRHGLNLFVVLVGESSKARKGTSWRQLSSLFTEVDRLWAARRVTTTRPTVNGIIHALRDQQPATDRRLFLLSEEFASVLHVLGQRTGQLSPLLRCAWDGGDLSAHDGHRPLQATGAHISIVGHVTQSELAHHLSRTESHNGFANRCLWTSVRRSKSLPEGGSLPPEERAAVARELRRALDWVHNQSGIVFRRTASRSRAVE